MSEKHGMLVRLQPLAHFVQLKCRQQQQKHLLIIVQIVLYFSIVLKEIHIN